MIVKNYYQILEISPTATRSEIVKSYRTLAKKFHPDRNFGSSSSEEKFKEVQEAYEILSNEERRFIYDDAFKQFYGHKNAASGFNSNSKNEQSFLTPIDILNILRSTRESFLFTSRRKIDKIGLYNKLYDLLNKENISLLLLTGNDTLNKEIIFEILELCRLLPFPYVENLCSKLAKLAGADNNEIRNIYSFCKHRKIRSYWDKYGAIASILLAVLLICLVNAPRNSNKEVETTQNNANKDNAVDSYNANINSKQYPASNPNEIEKPSVEPQQNYWNFESKSYTTGSTPGCYSFTPKFNMSLDNELEVKVGANTDVVIKLINLKTNKCIRCVFINSGDTYKLKHIPEGIYFVKIAYGRRWKEKYENNDCIGRFTENSYYKMGVETLNYKKIYTGVITKDDKQYETFKLPSYTISLDIKASLWEDRFKTDVITEKDFNE